METAERHGSRLVIANDPDSDRLAIAEKQKRYDLDDDRHDEYDVWVGFSSLFV
jgi:hypothetical protein